MGKYLFIIGLFFSVLVAKADVGTSEKNTFSDVDGVRYTYTIIVHHDENGNVVHVDNNQDVLITRVISSAFGKKLDVVTLPTRAYNEEYDVFVKFNGTDSGLSGTVEAKTLVIPKDVTWFFEGRYNLHPIGKVFDVEQYIIENDSKIGPYSEDGVIFEKREGEDFPYLVQLPVYAQRINYRIPSDVLLPYDRIFNNKLSYPLIITEENRNLSVLNLKGYPFWGIKLPYDCKNYIDIDGAELKTFENVQCWLLPQNLIVGIWRPHNDIKYYQLEFLFTTKYRANGRYNRQKTEYIEVRGDEVPNVNKIYDEFDHPFCDDLYNYYFDRDIITYINPKLVPEYDLLQRRALFPQNAAIEPTKNWIYLYPELDNGQWVNGQSQFIYAACRFGNAQIVKEEWSWDDRNVATVGQSGIVILTGGYGDSTITCTLTDQYGATYTAQKRFRVTEKGVENISSAIEEIPTEIEIPTVKGIYNLQGLYLGETIENLPAGIYICNGKKIMVK